MYNLIITNSKGGITRFELPAQNGAQVLIGRDKGCDVALTDETSLSRVHLVLTVMDDNILIQDNHSSNGLFRDSQKIESEYMLTGKTYYAANCSFVLVKKVVPLKKVKPAPRPQPAAPAVDYYSEPSDAESLKAVLAATCPSDFQDVTPQPVEEAAYYGESAGAAPQPVEEAAYYYGESAGTAPQPVVEAAYYGEPADAAPKSVEEAAPEAPVPQVEVAPTVDAGDATPSEIPADAPSPQQTAEPAITPTASPSVPPTAPRVTVRRPKGAASRVPKPMHNSVPGTILGLPCDFDLSVRIFSVREQPRGGDLLSFGAKADRSCYFYLIQYDSGGEGVRLVPGEAGETNKLFRGIETRFPSVGDHNYDIMVEEPFGQDTIIALASSRPCDFEKIWEQCYRHAGADERHPGQVEMAAIRSALARHKQLKWASAIIKLTTCAPNRLGK